MTKPKYYYIIETLISEYFKHELEFVAEIEKLKEERKTVFDYDKALARENGELKQDVKHNADRAIEIAAERDEALAEIERLKEEARSEKVINQMSENHMGNAINSLQEEIERLKENSNSGRASNTETITN